ncbi:NTP transferase domain-containing protein [Nitrospirillum viridazoti]|uniref:4-diphosphocytidyl-2C-methyl-D-erythritol kinase n=1 Tax=Nitrospirillum viridazoti CBAmc TaxID=1441467 RepID=A0A248JWG5_9PROT|nr:molybdopterin-binding/glycosyltransferase family 2 protein [Nitrospirillum amazonense]ASG22870.1 4-diphosphocytidyl-2C-methyl-D-erythritol kinase [Nitrospirillum amazonense CBAmc]TWB33667.1 molybdopterin molybdochelatase /molybdenum cofactor cytidylyltransferase [Nitrospirillum amazonense]
MRFGPLPVADAAGAVLAHSLKAGALRYPKGRRLTAADLADLAAAGVMEVVAVRLDPDDVGEDAAASRVAQAITGPGLALTPATTGRVNVMAEAGGLLLVDAARLNRLNQMDEAVTVATAAAFAPLAPGAMAATIKIIPFAIPEGLATRVEQAARSEVPALRLAPWRGIRAGLVQTRLPGLKAVTLDKTVAVTEARLAQVGGTLVAERRLAHDAAAVAGALADLSSLNLDLLLVIGASAITDRRDVLPTGIGQAGGAVLHFGMPVDPGNLMLLARLGDVPVLGLPGCARSPRINGFDWILQRVAAGLEVTPADIMGMGVGGLLTDIPSRPMPRQRAVPAAAEFPVTTLVLAAGSARRMGANKLLADYAGQPLVRHAVMAALAANPGRVTVVLGHQATEVRAALRGLDVRFIEAVDHAQGLSASLKAGLAGVAGGTGVLVCLGDMPRVTADTHRRLLARFTAAAGRAIVVPVAEGRRGNPVLWPADLVPAMASITGDQGARSLLAIHADRVVEVPSDGGVHLDVDTPDALAALRTLEPVA